MSKPVEEISDERIIKAMGHPLRMRILEALGDRERSPRELSDELDEPLGNVSYHVRLLLDLGMLRLTRTTQKRGAIEHHYELVHRPVISDRAWSRMPRAVKDEVVRGALEQAGADVDRAAGEGGFDRPDVRLSRLTLSLDTEGWGELARACDDLETRAREIEQRSSDRRGADSGPAAADARLVMMLFEASGERASRN
jgi:DNA-binding transcriptional ArsR family regulator